MTLLKNKILYVVGTHDCGKFIITNCLKNNPDVFSIDYITQLFKKHNNNLDGVMKEIDRRIRLNDIDKDLNEGNNYKCILLIAWDPIGHVIRNIENVLPIVLLRDVRVGWLVTEHKEEGSKTFKTLSIDEYIENYNELLKIYLYFERKNIPFLFFKFEEFLINKIESYKKLCKNLDIRFDSVDIPTVFRERSSLLSMFDVEKIVKFQKYVNDDQLSYISSKTKKYNEFFKYPYNLSKDDILEGLKI